MLGIPAGHAYLQVCVEESHGIRFLNGSHRGLKATKEVLEPGLLLALDGFAHKSHFVASVLSNHVLLVLPWLIRADLSGGAAGGGAAGGGAAGGGAAGGGAAGGGGAGGGGAGGGGAGGGAGGGGGGGAGGGGGGGGEEEEEDLFNSVARNVCV